MASVFTKIINREIPSVIYYEDDLCMAIKDIQPVSPVHAILFPKKEIVSMNDLSHADAALVGHCLVKATEVARRLKIADDGYRLVVNTGENGGQSVPHIHIHILGGRPHQWPPG